MSNEAVNNAEATVPARVIAVVTCDFERSPIGTRSRLLDTLGGVPVIRRTLERLLRVEGLTAIVLLPPDSQRSRAEELRSLGSDTLPIHVLPLTPRPATLNERIQTGRAWDLVAWRGGAGQYTVFDEDYHPAAVDEACKTYQADHVLMVPAHAPFLDPAMATQLVHHHQFKNHEMRLTYTPAAPGLCGIVLQADIVREMAEKTVLPGQLLAYDPNAPTFDTLIRDACMQVDPALSKIQNRFLVDTDRSFAMAAWLVQQPNFESPAAVAVAARDRLLRCLQGGTEGARRGTAAPREIEIELTGERLTMPPGSVPPSVRQARQTLDIARWINWFSKQHFPDDLLLTFAGDGDPLLYPGLVDVLRAARAASPRSIHLQTDLASDIHPLLACVHENLADVISVNFYGHDAQTYTKVCGENLFPNVMANMQKLADATRTNPRGTGLPLVIPRLLKVRDTIPQLEPFFDTWIKACGWAVIDYPTDRAGGVPFGAVVDMAPPKRRACRRLTDRLLLRASGLAVACDQDMHDHLQLGTIDSQSLEQLWLGQNACALRQQHAEGMWDKIDPCKSCREWHRA